LGSWPLIACLLFLSLLLPLTAAAQRIALVVGNAAYTDRPLRNPVNDAQLMQTTLRELGFEVQVATDVDRRGLLGALRDFEARARGAEVALFYFAGHGAQVAGANYLIPLNAPIRGESDVPDEAIDAASVLRRIEDGRARAGLVILDACRDNPYPEANRSITRGLGRMSVPSGTIVAYAAAPGSTAEDGFGDNGTYTAALAKHLSMPGLDIKDVFDLTAQEVERLTGGKQRPREEIGLRGRLVLREDAALLAVAPQVPAEITFSPEPSSAYASELSAFFRSSVVFTGALSGNFATEVEIMVAPDGQVTSRRILSASGRPDWDAAVLRAVDRAAALPRDIDGQVPRWIVAVFRPND
jgi:TonB family protein